MLRYKTKTRPGLVALYDIRPRNGVVLFLQPRSPHGYWGRERKGVHGPLLELNLVTSAMGYDNLITDARLDKEVNILEVICSRTGSTSFWRNFLHRSVLLWYQVVCLLMVTFWLELCTSNSSSYHHHLHHSELHKIQNGDI